MRKHAVSPKNVSIKEYEIILNAFKSLFMILERDYKGAQDALNRAMTSKNTFGSDAVSFKPTLSRPASQQHASLLTHIQSYLHTANG